MKQVTAILYNIRSVHNVGSMFRTADAAGVEKVFLVGITPTPLDRFGRVRPDFKKVSLGAEGVVAWEHVSTRGVGALLKQLRSDGYAVYAIEQSRRSILYHTVRVPKKKNIAFVVGNEVNGIPASILKRVDNVLEIPMRGSKESLNVSVAFGIALYTLRLSR